MYLNKAFSSVFSSVVGDVAKINQTIALLPDGPAKDMLKTITLDPAALKTAAIAQVRVYIYVCVYIYTHTHTHTHTHAHTLEVPHTLT